MFSHFSDHDVSIGCHSSVISPRNKSSIPIPGSLELNAVAEGSIVVVQDQQNPSTSGVPLTSVESPKYVLFLCERIFLFKSKILFYFSC